MLSALAISMSHAVAPMPVILVNLSTGFYGRLADLPPTKSLVLHLGTDQIKAS